MSQITVLNQRSEGETRVALVPAGVKKLKAQSVDIVVQAGAGEQAGIPDKDYVTAGATIDSSGQSISSADIVLSVGQPADATIRAMRRGGLLIGLLSPLGDRPLVELLCETGVNGIAMELIPRITRAQSMDALSSQHNIAGYKAVIIGAAHSTRIFPLMMTAAGTLQPVRAFVIGAGVAGLQAIVTARRLGAVASAYDVRPAVKEQIQSVGARFFEIPIDTSDSQDKGGYAKAQGEDVLNRQRQLLAKPIGESDLVITTAAVPGKPSPKLISAAAVEGMKPGSVIVDLAAERGGNCELTTPGEITQHNGVTIIGLNNLAATVPAHASQVYSSNMVNLLSTMIDKDGQLKVDRADEVIAAVMVCYDGQLINDTVRKSVGMDQTVTG